MPSHLEPPLGQSATLGALTDRVNEGLLVWDSKRRSGPSTGVRTDDGMAPRCAWSQRKHTTRLCLGHGTCDGAGRRGSATSAGLSVSVTAISARWDRTGAIPTQLVPMQKQVRRGSRVCQICRTTGRPPSPSVNGPGATGIFDCRFGRNDARHRRLGATYSSRHRHRQAGSTWGRGGRSLQGHIAGFDWVVISVVGGWNRRLQSRPMGKRSSLSVVW